MDANNTRYHLLLGKADWHRCDEDAPLALTWSLVKHLPDRDVLQLRGGKAPEHTEWDAARNELTLTRRMFQFTAAPRDVKAALEDRRGAARDRYGNWYFIDQAQRELRVRSSGSETVTKFWNAADGIRRPPLAAPGDFRPREADPPPAPLALGGVVVTADHYLVVGTLQPPGLLIFDLHAVGAPDYLRWPAQVPFAPFDMAPMSDGGLWILDRANKRCWALDRGFNIINIEQESVTLRQQVPDAFQPREGAGQRQTPARTFPTGIRGNAAVPLEALTPIAIEALPDGTCLILDLNPDGAFALVHRYRFGTRLGAPVSTGSTDGLLNHLVAHDFAFVPEHANPENTQETIPDRLYLVSEAGNQAIVYDLSLQGDQLVLGMRPDYLPMRRFGRRGVVAAGGRAWYDFGEDTEARWLPLVEQRRPRYEEEAVLFTPVFDGRDPDCVWHRLMLDACLPPDTQVQVSSRAANDKAGLLSVTWSEEPRPMLRREGSELPFVSAPVTSPTAGNGTWETLFQRTEGRYLQLKLVLSGDGRSTPRLRALRVYYPRFSYLANYLPAMYQEAAMSASFLDRLLANFEGMFTALEDRIAAVQVLFDYRSAPSETLDWLAQWFGIALDPSWDDARRRLFIKHAMDFFQYRGTVFGLKMALRLAFDDCAGDTIFDPHPSGAGARQHANSIRIAEKYASRRSGGGNTATGEGLLQEAPLLSMQRTAHAFTVHLPVTAGGQAQSEAMQRQMALARRIIELEKPAHTVFDIALYWAMFRVGDARLGEDSLIAEGSRAPQLLPPMVLGQGYLVESTLEPSYPQNIIDQRLVVGRDQVNPGEVSA